jgi:hypothetical protein
MRAMPLTLSVSRMLIFGILLGNSETASLLAALLELPNVC